MKKALITGVTGQDGSYLAELLLQKGYKVFGFLRRSSTEPLLRIEHLISDGNFHLVNGDLRDRAAIKRALEESQPDEIYNLAAQSDVGISFQCPEETWEINYHGVGRLVTQAAELKPNVKIYQASTSEMFGSTLSPQNENSPFCPVSPYAKAKLQAHIDYVAGYRSRGLFICSGILFNHESPRRGKHFVTRKITYSLAKIKLGIQKDCLELGNLNAKRDWGYAPDYVRAMYWMLQEDIFPEDYVIATGVNHTVREFVDAAAYFLGMPLTWSGEGVKEIGWDERGNPVVKVKEAFYRPNEVVDLRGDSRKANQKLNWWPSVKFRNLVEIMTSADMELAKKLQTK